MRRQVDGSLDSPSSDGSGRFHNGVVAASQEIQNNGVHQGSSPLTPTSAEGVTNENAALQERKTVKRPAPMRQVDDVTPKLKRRQPKVADAYRYVYQKCLKNNTDLGPIAAVGKPTRMPQRDRHCLDSCHNRPRDLSLPMMSCCCYNVRGDLAGR
jgi:hypothetical protein